MSKTLYLECNSGISGDMTVAALLDLGADAGLLQETLKSLPLTGFHTEITRVKKAGLDACDFNVILEEEFDNHDHDMEYLYGKTQTHHEHQASGHEHSAAAHEHSEGEHIHQDEQEHAHQNHVHSHRGLKEIYEILETSSLTQGAKIIACRIFEILGEAEARAHGESIETVHFHEVGAVDSIVDIAATAFCLDNLGITKVIVPYLCEGTGTVRCAHGILPIPVPAVANIVQSYELPLRITDRQGELVTPTGAAIVAAVCTGHKLPETMTIERIGIGAGKRAYEVPSLLRAMLLAQVEEVPEDRILKLECNIDDCTGETLGYVMEELLKAGARDVHYIPVFMKKNRPAYELVILCDPEDRETMENIIFMNTTTIGIRRTAMERTILKRKSREVITPWGTAKVKEVELPDGSLRAYPEYEVAAAIARREHIALTEVYRKIVEAAADGRLPED